MKRVATLSIYCIYLFLTWVRADEQGPYLRIAYGQHNGEPYVMTTEGRVLAGIVKDLGDELAARLHLVPEYVNIPRKRLDGAIQKGDADVSFISSKKWTPNETAYLWSEVLFVERDVFLFVRKADPPYERLEQMEGLKVGTILGYVYPELDSLFELGYLVRDDALNLEQSINKLLNGRVDVVVNADRMSEYLVKRKNLAGLLEFGRFPLDSNEIRARFSPEKLLPVKFEQINKALNEMIEEGFVERVLEKYR